MVVFAQRQILPGLTIIPLPAPRPTPTTRSAGLTRSAAQGITQSVPSSSTDVISLTQASSTASSTETSISLTTSAVTSSVTSETPTSVSVEPSLTPIPIPIETTSDSGTFTVTSIETVGPSPSPSIQAAPSNSSSGFLQNKVLSGVVFAVVGVVALVLILLVITIAIRRSRRRRLVEEAVSFDPTAMGGSQIGRGSDEKRRFSLLSSDYGHGGGSSSNHGSGFGAEMRPAFYSPPPVPTPAAAYPRQEPHHFPATADNQYSFGGNPQQPWYGGAANDPYGTYLPPSNLSPARMYSNEPSPSQRSATPVTSSDRARSPESQMYRPTGLKIANA